MINKKETPVTLTIAGSDSGGGAGIQADLKTFQELGTFGTSVLTAVTAQNTTGVQEVFELPTAVIQSQLTSVATDFDVRAFKTGMLSSSEVVETVADALVELELTDNYVMDPVMIAKGGAPLLQESARQALIERLLPLAKIVTPNVHEAEFLTGRTIDSPDSRLKAAKELLEHGPEVVIIKGGHYHEDAPVTEDFLLTQTGKTLLATSPRIDTPNTHGTGCTFAAALTSGLAAGLPLEKTFKLAKAYILAAISEDLHLGSGHGPTNHAAFNQKPAAYLRQVKLHEN